MAYHQYGTKPNERDYEDLAARGISRQTVDDQHIRRVDDAEGRIVTGFESRKRHESFAGRAIPYFLPGHNAPREYRVRRDQPTLVEKADGTIKEEMKYVTHEGVRNMAFFTRRTRPEFLSDTSLPIIITEGEWKTMALDDLAWAVVGDASERPAWLSVGISGVWNWKGMRGKREGPDGKTQQIKGLIPDFDLSAWKGRKVSILFDVDVHTNDDVRIARYSLAKELRERSARVLFIDIPREFRSKGAKGIDDVIGQLGPEIALEIINSAYDPKPRSAGAKPGRDNVRLSPPSAAQGEPPPPISDAAQPAPRETKWRSRLISKLIKPLDSSKPIPKPLGILANVITVLTYADEWHELFAFNEFNFEVVTRRETPWKKPAGTSWTDTDDSRTADWLQRHEDIFVNSKLVAEAVQVVAGDHPFHPLREQIKNLRRDSKSADLDTWMIVGLGALDTPYVREVGKRWMISMIARVDKPGCKADHVILLESPQGTGKSSALKTLAGGEEYFSDRLSDLGSKDSMLEMAGVWVIEMSEIPNLRGVALERFKAFISSTTDRFRPPYGRRIVKHPRQCVLAASTNSEEPFIDPTGTRRIWPVKCGNIDLDWLKQHREQLLAEARDCYLNGDKWWLETPELEAMAKAEQDERYQPGVWDETILDWIDNPEQRWIWIDNPELRTTDENKPDEGKPLKISIPVIPWNGSQAGKVTINDILIHGLSKDTARHSPPDRNQVANCLRHAGWKRRRDRTRGPSRDKGFYYSPERWKEERW